MSFDTPSIEPTISVQSDFHILREKLQIPSAKASIPRPRIERLLARSRQQFPATLIAGRAGTGKTAVAVAFVEEMKRASWYTVEAADVDWAVFSRYFSESLKSSGIADPGTDPAASIGNYSQRNIARFLSRHFLSTEGGSEPSSIIVLDDVHHIFDAEWFEEFFNLLIYSLPPEVHLLMLCRSKPPAPMWRMRSKQMLNVLDEKEIAFDAEETKGLFDLLGMPAADAETARKKSFGRVSKLLQTAG